MMATPILQKGVAVWVVLLLLSGAGGWMLYKLSNTYPAKQLTMHKTITSLALAKQALLAYAQQPLGLTQCESNCPRPGDLPCPDRNNDGIAETSCSNTPRLGRLPWKTLGIGDLRDGSGERLWYAVSERYKNNPRILPLNLDTPGTWSLLLTEGLHWDATQGNGVVAVLIAPMHPLVREDGWIQQRQESSSEIAKHYLDVHALDNASPVENTVNGFVMAASSPHFNDVVWPITAGSMHQQMQKHVLSELKRSLRCTLSPCPAYPSPAAAEDDRCLGFQSVTAGQCLPTSVNIGRLPVDPDVHWPGTTQHMLDGDARHHWFQQNSWREQVFYQPASTQTTIIVAGERLPGQSRESTTDKGNLNAYLEASTLQALQAQNASALTLPSNDIFERVMKQ
ncbi:MAG: hypothetical protein DWQ56_16505 [Microcystis aeruginosa DA14]|uniref:Uncharacterized protein n=1 Tax=Microcystis aeruginosa DA14 TaxID=1987506 RepID=A0A3E0M8A6_MICAE|nr:MAG: hypothetical protein DWQ56_16505 [Microcystis aeruginosa DA14]